MVLVEQPRCAVLKKDFLAAQVVEWKLVTHSHKDSRLLGLGLPYSTQMSFFRLVSIVNALARVHDGEGYERRRFLG